jgi:hypothetical protein
VEPAKAVVSIQDTRDGIICNESKNLSLDEYNAEVMRSMGIFPDFEAEKEIQNKLNEFSSKREMNI